jgi:hypothetical protein
VISKHIETLDIEFLFSWDNVPGNDSERLLRYLEDSHNIGWAESAEICKSNDGKIIRIFKHENSAEIMINEKEEKATLKISDAQARSLKVKKENSKLNMYDMCKREEMYLKIPELNRPTLKSSLRDMYSFYEIAYSDLFPDFEFVKIRDKIVHTGLSEEHFKDLKNYDKLVALSQRTILGMLNYTGEFIDRSDNRKHKKFKKKID